MSEFKVLMPKMGESVQEATITKWFVKEGDTIEEDDLLFEIATEKVDSEIPSPVDGVISKILYGLDEVVPVGEIVAYIKTDDEEDETDSSTDFVENTTISTEAVSDDTKNSEVEVLSDQTETTRFYSPLVRSIAKEENISIAELETIPGSGENGRVQKNDILNYIENKSKSNQPNVTPSKPVVSKAPLSIGAEDQIVEMGRVRKLIADHMVNSAQSAPHVTSVVEADVTNLVFWRKKAKDAFMQKYGEKLTYMPMFTEAVATALREFPMVNASVDGDKIILRSKVNVGIAVSKPDGNLIVPVITNADQKNLVGLTSSLNDLANRARNNKLTPDEISGGTFSITNFGSFRNIIGTPIINQPQVAILATGSIEKKPAVLETPTGDVIAIRHKMFLSLSYDHRIVDGALGGAFLRRIADLLEEFDINRAI
ncbi:MAG: dihydrolipoamide acetyltransferase family protein [Prolixibacteraceae bacterium]|jgi:2-oxoglutarate dehydrogenase E2 component (dihydrolipoamide succinyltransferase)|nr:dihydrolipoamide acetyltransferase family protein [Prolixibacteraceae bacterium]